MPEIVETHRGAYRDSVSLMQVSRAVGEVPGVSDALVAMATELNLDLLRGLGFTVPEAATPNDMIVAIRAGEDALGPARERLAAALTEGTPTTGGGTGGGPEGLGAPPAPRTVGSAAARSGANLALISTPGRHAFVEAADALEHGLSVVLFSDNMPVEQECLLKDMAAARGLLVMGPDCGTAVVSGVGLGFANVVRPGPVGIVAASGTGAQQLMCLLDHAGTGVSHCLGTGGRDLSAEVAGRSTRQALAALDADPATELIVVVSKPPAPRVAREIREYAGTLSTPVRFAVLGQGLDLTSVAEQAVRDLGGTPPRWPHWDAPDPQRPRPGALRGLFCGGTLCDEAMLITADRLGPIRSNIPLRPEWALPADLSAPGHLMIDFGDDRLTAGRAHPMIDGALRLDRIAAEAADPECAVLLLDLVLGLCAHPDPAAELAPAIASARATAAAGGRDLAVVVSVTGSTTDPQGLDRQAARVREAGAAVFLSNAAAARHAAALIEIEKENV
ncbi:FdrA family protein [Streptosporangium sp. NPDC051022]|uniref:FdrA family protein n=1 Tax=Streptosporangium sp. NPDC051022 TaxID=3155752 RepID=UPI00341C1731